jgi:hypothetical protein
MYDVNGNLTGNGTKTFIYDVENRLIEVKNSADTVWLPSSMTNKVNVQV